MIKVYKLLMLIMLAFSSTIISAQQQVGQTIFGAFDESYSNFGGSITANRSGTRIAVGDPYYDASGLEGRVIVYDLVGGTTWVPLYVLSKVNNNLGYERFGLSISINENGTRLVVSGKRNFVSNYVCVFDLNTGMQVGQDILALDYDGDDFASVDISEDGNSIVIGGEYGNSGLNQGSDPGVVRIFDYDEGNDLWTQTGADITGDPTLGVILSNSFIGENFGQRVKIANSGNRIVASSDGAGFQGRVRVYDYDSGSDNWLQVGTDLIGDVSGEDFGESISISGNGDTLLIGAPDNIEGSSLAFFKAGAAKVFTYNVVENDWQQLGNTILPTEFNNSSSSQFGESVALSEDGQTVVVGFPNKNINDDQRGQVQVFTLSNSNWVKSSCTPEGEHTFDRFGSRLAVSGDGRYFYASSNVQGIDNPLGDDLDDIYIPGNIRVYDVTKSCCSSLSFLENRPGIHNGAFSFEDDDFTYYCNAAGNLLLGLQLDENLSLTNGDTSITLKVEEEGASYYPFNTGFIINPDGGTLLNRRWDVSTTGISNSTSGVRFFRDSFDLDYVNNAFNEETLGNVSSASDFQFFKITSGESFDTPVADLSINDIVFISNGAIPSTFVYTEGTLSDKEYVEYRVDDFSGGGGGVGPSGTVLPILEEGTSLETATKPFLIEVEYLDADQIQVNYTSEETFTTDYSIIYNDGRHLSFLNQLLNSGSGSFIIDISNLTNGYYFLKVYTETIPFTVFK